MKTLTTKIKAAALGTAGIAVSAVAIDRVLSKIKETAISLVSNISPSDAQGWQRKRLSDCFANGINPMQA